MACWAVVMRARVGSPRFVPKLETRTSSAMPVTLRDVVAQVLRSCVRFVASLLLRCRGRFSRLLRALPHEAGFFQWCEGSRWCPCDSGRLDAHRSGPAQTLPTVSRSKNVYQTSAELNTREI